VGAIWYFQGSGGTWTRAQGTLRGRVLAAADDGSSTFLLYQSSTGVWIAKRPHTGGLADVQRVSSATQGGGPRTAGDLVAFTDQWWAVWTEQVGPGGEFAPQKLFQSKTIGAGDCIDPIVKQQIIINPTVDRAAEGRHLPGVVFVAYRDFRQHPFLALYRNGTWSGRDLTPGAGGQQVVAVTAAGGRGTVLAASEVTNRLYAVADL
jgi:hypothetical protein